MQSVVAPLCEAVLFGWCLREGVRASVAISCPPPPHLIGLVVYLCRRRVSYPSSVGDVRFSSRKVVYLPIRNLDADDCSLSTHMVTYTIYK